jgi:serine phosphatase RsbU (regulator of sigma subunit)/anti-sigma regulatory factor (Ser/Thr protein kinase)
MCFLWRPDVLALHVTSDALIALAYFSIPLMLATFVRRRKDVPFSGVFWMFSVFIVSCGCTHIMAIVVIWHPWYWLEGAIKAVTAVASIATAILLVPILPRALNLRTPAELERINTRLQSSIDEAAVLLRRYEREHYIATTFQSASLGDVPDALGPLRLSAVYQPGVGDLEIGGDWYDAFRLPDGRAIVSIGDVSGKGLAASIVMAKMRQAIRVAAQVQVAPGAILDAADRALTLEYPDAIVTAFVGIIDDTESLLVYANAGHPPPYLRDPEGKVTELVADGLPLGLRLGGSISRSEDAHISLAPGALIVLYTDGLTEATHDYAIGESRLLSALRDDGTFRARNPARAIHDRVLREGARDDVAILTVRFVETPGVERWSFEIGDRDAAIATRDAIVARLVEHGATPEETFEAELIFGELIGNVARYAGGLADIRLDLDADAPVLHVLDRGGGFEYVPGLPANIFAESGRGLYIVEHVTRDFTISRRPDGGSHARAVLPLALFHTRAAGRSTVAAFDASDRSTESTGGAGDVKPIASS